MFENKLILVTGGAASGKSAFAESLITKSDFKQRLYIATMKSYDEETIKRIEKHHIMRQKKSFSTVEIYGKLFCNEALSKNIVSDKAILLECMSNYLSNMLFAENGLMNDIEEVIGKIICDIVNLKNNCPYTVIVSNEIFSDGNRYSYETEEYIKALGSLNVMISELANEVYEVVCGIPIKVKKVNK